MGGEEIQVDATGTTPTPALTPIDEATGFSGWSTVAIKRTTVRTEQKAQREAQRRQKREAELQAKETEARRMEQAKVDNADDSALGAFDVWNRTSTGYKGVDLHAAKDAVQVHDWAKPVAAGRPVAFKAKKKKTTNNDGQKNTNNKKQNRRTTSADD
jgi:WW domain-binding protein 4